MQLCALMLSSPKYCILVTDVRSSVWQQVYGSKLQLEGIPKLHKLSLDVSPQHWSYKKVIDKTNYHFLKIALNSCDKHSCFTVRVYSRKADS